MATEDSNLVELARRIACEAFQGKYRRDGKTPAIRHMQDVVDMLGSRYSAEEVAAAWLHDVLEDTHITAQDLLREGIPASVVDMVMLLTKPDTGSYDDYIRRIASDPRARWIKLADMLANFADAPTKAQRKKYFSAMRTLTLAPQPQELAGKDYLPGREEELVDRVIQHDILLDIERNLTGKEDQ